MTQTKLAGGHVVAFCDFFFAEAPGNTSLSDTKIPENRDYFL